MDDATFTFAQTASERKRNSRGAAARKCGSKSKKCSLPSDHLTAAQRKKLDGECKSYELSKPMKWDAFQSLPKDLQSEYIKKLSDMGASRDDICDMFGCKKAAYASYMKNHHGGEKFFPRGHLAHRDNEEFITWYCNTVEESPESEAKEPEKPVETTAVEDLSEPEIESVDLGESSLSSGSLTYTGHAKAIFEQVMFLLDESAKYKITVSFEEKAS